MCLYLLRHEHRDKVTDRAILNTFSRNSKLCLLSIMCDIIVSASGRITIKSYKIIHYEKKVHASTNEFRVVMRSSRLCGTTLLGFINNCLALIVRWLFSCFALPSIPFLAATNLVGSI